MKRIRRKGTYRTTNRTENSSFPKNAGKGMPQDEKVGKPPPISNLMIIDCNGLCHMVKHNTRNLLLRGRRTGIAFGFLRLVKSIAEIFTPDKILFIWDTPTSTGLRRSMYPLYKNKPVDKAPEDALVDNMAYEQFNDLREKILPKLGFRNIFLQDGYEADDLIAYFAMKPKLAQFKTIVTIDEDIYQCLTPAVQIYNPRKKEIITAESFEKDYSIHPGTWSLVKAIAGCTSDNVEGLPGIGEKTAIKFLNTKLNPKTKAFQTIKKGSKVIERNLKLVSLPLPGVEDFEIVKDRTTKKAYIDVCTLLGFQSMLKTKYRERWNEIFKLK